MNNSFKTILLLFVAAASFAAEPADNIRFEKKLENLIVAMSGREEVGSITYSAPHCFISGLSVNKDMRRKGIGSQLFKKAIHDMKNCECIQWTATLQSMDFYFKQGAELNYIEEGRARRLQYLYKLRESDPMAVYVPMYFDNKQQKQ